MSREYRVRVTGSDTKNGKAEIEWSVADYKKLLSEFEQLKTDLKREQQVFRKKLHDEQDLLSSEVNQLRLDFEKLQTEWITKFQSLQDSFNELTGIIDQYIEGGKLHFGIR